ncbi:MAG: pseudouridylate synthase [Bdellovibrio sp. CG10_big_fil_rev_8_21_14_0_10_47_8]|nr:MAG: pseudouridylate synthase [Bdellovibrio sp. CG10_big_fil_rev_8_21_14_0_10_47_8]
MPLDILYQDQHYIAVHKPAGLLVHRTNLAQGEDQAALQILRDQIGDRVYPVHRLDRPTSGALIFALSPTAARSMSLSIREKQVSKKYVAIVRGHLHKEVHLNYPLKESLDKISDKKAQAEKPAQAAETYFRPLAHIELPFAVDRYPTSRYSLIEAQPVTGRKHQIRKHLKHLSHPIVGDVNHGNGKHNQFFAKHFGIQRLMLACTEISFTHPVDHRPILIRCPVANDLHHLIQTLPWNHLVTT